MTEATEGTVAYRTATLDDVPMLAELREVFTFEDGVHSARRPDFRQAFSTTVGNGIDESVGFYERAGFASARDPLVWESRSGEPRT